MTSVAKRSDEFEFARKARRMQTGEKMVVIFSKSTCRTEGTGSRITAMYNFANRKKAVDPFTEEGEAKGISKEEGLK